MCLRLERTWPGNGLRCRFRLSVDFVECFCPAASDFGDWATPRKLRRDTPYLRGGAGAWDAELRHRIAAVPGLFGTGLSSGDCSSAVSSLPETVVRPIGVG